MDKRSDQCGGIFQLMTPVEIKAGNTACVFGDLIQGGRSARTALMDIYGENARPYVDFFDRSEVPEGATAWDVTYAYYVERGETELSEAAADARFALAEGYEQAGGLGELQGNLL